MKSISLERGGHLNGSFLKSGLMNDISLLIYPAIGGLAAVAGIYTGSSNGSIQGRARHLDSRRPSDVFVKEFSLCVADQNLIRLPNSRYLSLA